MKKLLGATLAIVMGATLVGGLAACNTNDDEKNADIAKKAISTVRAMYLDKAKETPATYTVIGQSKVDGTNYDVNWTATPAADCTIENFSSYVSVGAMAEDKLVTVSITKSTEMAINYKLNASVTVGNATESVSFDRTVPKNNLGVQTQSVAINFTTDTRKSYSTTQTVFEENGVKLTNDKGNSTYDNVTNVNPVRIYKNSFVKIEYPGMLQLVFHSAKGYTDSNYPAYLLQSLQADLGDIATITSDSTNADDPTVTVKLNNPVDILEFTANAGQIRLTKIDIDAVVGGATDADKVAVAKASLDLATKNYTVTGTYDLPATKSGANISWAVSGASDYVSIDGGKLKITSMPAADTDVTLTATISSGSVTDTKDITIKLISLGLTNDGTLEHPYTPSEAKLVAQRTLALGATAETEVYVKGYVIAPGTYNATFNNFDNMYIADVYAADKDSTAPDALYIFRPKPDGTYLTTDGFIKNDLVTFKGKLQNYTADVQELTSGVCVAKVDAPRTDAEIVADAKAEVDLTTKRYVTKKSVDLPATLSGATLSWAVKETTDVVTIAEGKLTINSLPVSEATFTIQVTISSGEVTDTKDIVITVVAPTPFEAGTYKLALQQVTLGKKLYFSGALSGNYGATTKSVFDAADVVIAAKEGVTNGFTLQVGGKYLELVVSSKYTNVTLSATSTAAWVYDYELEVFTWTNANGTFYLGTYGTNDTIRASLTSYISGSNAEDVGVTQFVLGCEKFDYSALTEAEKVALVKDLLTLDETTFRAVGSTALPSVTAADDVTVTWASSNTTLVTVAEGNLNVLALPETDTTVTLTATVTCGSVTEEKTVEIVIKKAGGYQLDTTLAANKGTNNSYAGNGDVKVNGVTWNVEGNATMQPWRFGGKSITDTDRKLTGKTAISGKIASIDIDFTDSGSITINSVTLNVFKSDPTVDGAVATYTQSVAYQKGKVTVTAGTGEDWTDCYYQIVFNVTVSGSSNKYVSINTMTFNPAD